MLQQRKVDPGVLPKHLAMTACRSTFPGLLVDSLKLFIGSVITAKEDEIEVNLSSYFVRTKYCNHIWS